MCKILKRTLGKSVKIVKLMNKICSYYQIDKRNIFTCQIDKYKKRQKLISFARFHKTNFQV